MKKIAVIGCGTLGSIFVKNLEKAVPGAYKITGVMARTLSHAQALAEQVGCGAYTDLEKLLADQPDYVVEIAGGPAAKEYGKRILEHGCDFVIVSVGALADDVFRTELEETAKAHGRKIYVPNGAVGGFDLMRTMEAAGILSASIESRKAPGGLNGAPYLEGRLLSETEEETVFSGRYREAIKGFPKNVNVAVATALASGCPDTQVTVKSVPGQKETRHTLRAESAYARMELNIALKPDPENPRSTVSTAWSVIALFRNLASTICYF